MVGFCVGLNQYMFNFKTRNLTSQHLLASRLIGSQGWKQLVSERSREAKFASGLRNGLNLWCLLSRMLSYIDSVNHGIIESNGLTNLN